MFVTTSYHPQPERERIAKKLAERLSVPCVPRERKTLKQLFAETGFTQAVVVSQGEIRWEDREGRRFFFHPSMSAVRVKRLRSGGSDPLVESSGMRRGDEVLDCTLGMGADAIVASFAAGPEGRVVALESQLVIAALVEHGLRTYSTDRADLTEAMRSVEVVCADYRDYLPRLPDKSFDIVMFDPMFGETVRESSAMQALRPLANPEPLDPESVKEAVRVARRAVLLKERRGSGEFARLGFRVAKEASKYAFGVIRVEGENG